MRARRRAGRDGVVDRWFTQVKLKKPRLGKIDKKGFFSAHEFFKIWRVIKNIADPRANTRSQKRMK
jgi:hypothetical protein